MAATASLFKDGQNQAVRLPKGLEFEGFSEVEIRREGNSIILTPIRQTWLSFANTHASDEDFLKEREDIVQDGESISMTKNLHTGHQYIDHKIAFRFIYEPFSHA